MGGRAQELSLVITEYCDTDPAKLRGFRSAVFVRDEHEAAAYALSGRADCVLLGYKEGHTAAADEAVRIAEGSGAAVLLVFFGDAPSAVIKQCADAGILVCHVNALGLMLPALRAVKIRIRGFESRTDSLKQKLDDAKLVNRAKLLLMSQLNMSEEQAHRYIEKTAMDSSKGRREVAENIIRIYEA